MLATVSICPHLVLSKVSEASSDPVCGCLHRTWLHLGGATLHSGGSMLASGGPEMGQQVSQVSTFQPTVRLSP